MIEDVEELSAKLRGKSFGNLLSLAERRIQVPKTRAVEQASGHASEHPNGCGRYRGATLRPAAVRCKSGQRSGVRRAKRCVYRKVSSCIRCLCLWIDSGSARPTGMKDRKVPARVVDSEITRVPEEVRAAGSPDSTRITPLGARLPRPSGLIFENPIELPAFEQSFVSLHRWEAERR